MNRRTTCMLSGMTLLGLAVAAVPQAGLAQNDPAIGTWKLNLAKSTYSPGPPPRSQTITTQAEGQGHKFTVEGVDAQGNPLKAVFMTRPRVSPQTASSCITFPSMISSRSAAQGAPYPLDLQTFRTILL